MFHLLKKIKRLLKVAKSLQDDTTLQTNHTDMTHTNDADSPPKDTKDPHPITTQIMTWLDKHEWTYEHREPSEGQVHHVILGFKDRDYGWTCVFRINESNELVVVMGILDVIIPTSHHTAMLMALTKANLGITFGGIDFDPNDGEVRAKIAIDAEFTTLNDKSLGSYLQALAGLTQLAQNSAKAVLEDSTPSQFVGDYVEMTDEVISVLDDEKQVFFLPTHTPQ